MRTRAIEVLVVDDDADARDLLHVSLSREGFSVRTASCVEDAVAAARHTIPDVVVTDLAMPGGGGRALAAELRSDPRMARLAIVAATGHIDPHWAIVRFFDAYLCKPLDLQMLADLLVTLVDASERSAASQEG